MNRVIKNGEMMYSIGGDKFLSVKTFKGVTKIHIRQYFGDIPHSVGWLSPEMNLSPWVGIFRMYCMTLITRHSNRSSRALPPPLPVVKVRRAVVLNGWASLQLHPAVPQQDGVSFICLTLASPIQNDPNWMRSQPLMKSEQILKSIDQELCCSVETVHNHFFFLRPVNRARELQCGYLKTNFGFLFLLFVKLLAHLANLKS